ncbi:MAG: glycosyltransferase [Limisphaerales bacterium]
MPRVLYIDTPFESGTGGACTRSRLIYRALRSTHETDLLLVHPHHGPTPSAQPASPRFPPTLELKALPPRWFSSRVAFRIGAAGTRAYLDLLSRRRYDAVVCRLHTPWLLAAIASNHPSHPALIVDLDLVSSRLVGLKWRQAPSFRNIGTLVERIHLERLEHRILRKPWLVFFSNPAERDQLALDLARQGSRVRLGILPNILIPPTIPPHPESSPVILFFGCLDSPANTDAFRFLMGDILPLIDADLRRHRVTIHVAGIKAPPWFSSLIRESGSDRVALVGPVNPIETAIADSRFVLLPLRVASGTRTRILEAAAQLRTVITTPLGAEGIAVGSDAIVAPDATGIASGIRRLLDAPDRAVDLGRRLGDRCRHRYSESRVAGELLTQMRDFLETRRESRSG